MLNLIFFALFQQLAAGILLPLLFISLEEIGAAFFRLLSALAAILLALAWWAHPFDNPLLNAAPNPAGITPNLILGLMAAAIAILLAGSFWIRRLKKNYLFPAAAAALAAVILASWLPPVSPALATLPAAWRAASFAGSALILGTVMSAMITGHWYLVNRRLTIQPLRIASLMFLGAAVLRLLLVIAVIAALAFSSESLAAQTAQTLLRLSGPGWLFWLRVLIGLIGPLIFAGMIYATVKIRSTQSATGMLYATVVLVFIGEAFSKFIWLFTGIPV